MYYIINLRNNYVYCLGQSFYIMKGLYKYILVQEHHNYTNDDIVLLNEAEYEGYCKKMIMKRTRRNELD